MAKNHYVYYLFSPQGVLLYIGRTHDVRRRHYQFEKRTGIKTELGWCQRFTHLAEACVAEKEAITKHAPPYNQRIQSSPSSSGIPCSLKQRSHLSQLFKGSSKTKTIDRSDLSIALKSYWNDDSRVLTHRAALSSPDALVKRKKAAMKQWSDPETRQRILEGQARRWSQYYQKKDGLHG